MIEFFKRRNRVRTFKDILVHLDKNLELLIISDEYKIAEKDLERIYDILILCGAGQEVNGYYVAAESLVRPKTLRWLLSHYKNGNFVVENMDYYDSMFYITDQLLNKFLDLKSNQI